MEAPPLLRWTLLSQSFLIHYRQVEHHSPDKVGLDRRASVPVGVCRFVRDETCFRSARRGYAALHNRVAGAAFGGHRVVGKSSVWCGWSRGRTVVVWIVVDLGFAFVLVSQ